MIESLHADVRQLPLARPYRLSFASLRSIDCILVQVRLSNGQCGWGEATPLPGYGHETVDSVLSAINDAQAIVVGQSPPDACCALRASHAGSPFAISALMTAIDDAIQAPGDLPLRGRLARGVQFNSGDALAEALERAATEGFTTAKIKVGRDLQAEIAAMRALAKRSTPIIGMRVDANQSLLPRDADLLCAVLEDTGCAELLEQPFPIAAWSDTEHLANHRKIPIMLDEPILGPDDVCRAADAGAALVKLKLCKQAGPEGVVETAVAARELGLRVVLGNGVSSTVNNAREFAIARDHPSLFEPVLEANGFLRLKSDPFGAAWSTNDDTVIWDHLPDPGSAQVRSWLDSSS